MSASGAGGWIYRHVRVATGVRRKVPSVFRRRFFFCYLRVCTALGFVFFSEAFEVVSGRCKVCAVLECPSAQMRHEFVIPRAARAVGAAAEGITYQDQLSNFVADAQQWSRCC